MLPRDFSKKIPIYIIAGYICLVGFAYIFSVLLAFKDHSMQSIGSPVQSVVLGLALIYLSTSLIRGLYRAWVITLSLIAVGVCREVLLLNKAPNIPSLTLLLVAGGSLIAMRRLFTTKSDAARLRSSLLVSSILVTVALTYGTLGFLKLPEFNKNHRHTLQSALKATLEESSFSRSEFRLKQTNKRSEAFLISLRTLSFMSITLAGYSLLQPLIYRRERDDEAKSRARMLLEKYGGNSEDYFKLWPNDKDYLFSEDGQAAIAYKVRGGVALSAGDPIGNPKRFPETVNRYRIFAKKHGFTMSFIHITDRYKSLYEDEHLLLQKIGEEAVVNLEKFTEKTIRNKKWRHTMNKFEKLGYSFELRKAPHSNALLHELQRISDSWLESPGRSERGFVLGYFNEDYLQDCDIAVLKNEEGQIAGFINLIESFDPSEGNMDLFRQRSGSPTNMTDYMVAKLLVHCHEQGFTTFNLGLCPLVGLTDQEQTGPVSRALSLLYTFGGKLYSFKGLYQFKSKFEPEWRDRYIATEPGAVNLIKTAQALGQAMKIK
jgi:phosphatidylglycerol lysyltransferase